MSKLIRFAVACVAACAGASAARADEKNELPAAVAAALEKADKVEVYSLTGDRAKEEPAWHGYASLGKTTVKGDDLKNMIEGVRRGVAEGKDGARCFIPRHGVSVTRDGKTYDLVICFECNWVYVYEGDKKLAALTTSGAAHKQLDKILTDAGVKLAKPAK